VERLKLYLRAPLREREGETVCLFVEFESEEIGVFYPSFIEGRGSLLDK